jgi:hypothetical protein
MSTKNIKILKKIIDNKFFYDKMFSMNTSKFNCPLCNSQLHLQYGNAIHPNGRNFGITLFCVNLSCAAQEVAGHGDNEDKAFTIVQQKFGG